MNNPNSQSIRSSEIQSPELFSAYAERLAEQEELDLTRAEERVAFSENIAALAAEAATFAKLMGVEGADASDLAAELQTATAAVGDVVTDTEIDVIQKKYNALLNLRDEWRAAAQTMVKTQEQESAKETVSSEELPPSEADVAALMRRVHGAPWYTAGERNKAVSLCESVHRTMAEAGSAEAARSLYGQLETHVSDIEQSAEPAALRKRGSEIVERMRETLPPSSQTLQEAEFLAGRLTDAQASEAAKEAFTELETYAFEHASQWVRVCGLALPSGPGETAASIQAFRETLTVMRDRHPALRQDPQKQILTDKLIRQLVKVPESGLTEAVLKDVYVLALRINVHEGLPSVPSVAPPVAEKAEAPVRPLQTVRRKDMEIETNDGESPVAISVSPKAAKQFHTKKQKQQKQSKQSKKDRALKRFRPKADSKQSLFTPKTPAAPDRTRATETVIHERRKVKHPLTDQLLTDARYEAFISAAYSSPAAYERVLTTAASQIDAETSDRFSNWLGEEQVSPFKLLREMTVAQVIDLSLQTDVRDILDAEHIQYETFVYWVDLLDEMKEVVEVNSEDNFGELFARWVTETLLAVATEERID